ncbi:hypothetical protein [Rhodovulum marinum]|uniref:hypothetical protein n=1 Tax=Rhodovulum marinum TaxID=320662 RepID=UPI0010479D06|nr:hypothetical protein [Rhodovulum marinum]
MAVHRQTFAPFPRIFNGVLTAAAQWPKTSTETSEQIPGRCFIHSAVRELFAGLTFVERKFSVLVFGRIGNVEEDTPGIGWQDNHATKTSLERTPRRGFQRIITSHGEISIRMRLPWQNRLE